MSKYDYNTDMLLEICDYCKKEFNLIDMTKLDSRYYCKDCADQVI